MCLESETRLDGSVIAARVRIATLRIDDEVVAGLQLAVEWSGIPDGEAVGITKELIPVLGGITNYKRVRC